MLRIDLTNGFLIIDYDYIDCIFTCRCELFFISGKSNFGMLKANLYSKMNQHPKITFSKIHTPMRVDNSSNLDDVYVGINNEYIKCIEDEYFNISSNSNMDIFELHIEEMQYSEMASSQSVFRLIIYIILEILVLYHRSDIIDKLSIMKIVNIKRPLKAI